MLLILDLMLFSTLQKFIDAHRENYENALAEIKKGKKRSHWMWYVFPQIKGLGSSLASEYYGIHNFEEAKNYLEHPLLKAHLVEIATALLQHKDRSANTIFGSPDDKKLRSSMTLFSIIPGTDPVFELVLEVFFKGERDIETLDLLENTMGL